MNLSFSDVMNVVIATLGGQVVLLGIAGWIARNFIIEKLERNRMQLEKDMELKLYKSQVEFSKLHEDRAEAIAEIYALLVEFEHSAAYFFSEFETEGEPAQKEKYELAYKAWYGLHRYFAKKRLYLPEATCQQIDDWSRKLLDHVVRFGSSLRHDNMTPEQTGYVAMQLMKDSAWSDGLEHIREELPVTKRQLEDELRALLGMETSEDRPS